MTSKANSPKPNTLETLRSTASMLFSQRGYAGTSMSRIAESVGVRKASLYNYYDSKEALLEDLVERGMEAWSEACHGCLEGAENPPEQLRTYFYAIFAFVDAHPETAALIRVASMQIGGALGEHFRRPVLEEKEQMVNDVARLCQVAMKRGQMAPANPRELALFWTATVDGILIDKLFATAWAREYQEGLEKLWQRLWVAVGGVDAS